MEIKSYDLKFINGDSPILVSDDLLHSGDYFLVEGVGVIVCVKTFVKDEVWCVLGDDGNTYREIDVYRVVAMPYQFGWSYNEGPPHDHNRVWRDTRYLEDFHYEGVMDRAKENDNKITVVVHEVCPNYGGSHLGSDCSCKSGFIYIPLLHDGKIIMDTYNILRKSLGTFVY